MFAGGRHKKGKNTLFINGLCEFIEGVAINLGRTHVCSAAFNLSPCSRSVSVVRAIVACQSKTKVKPGPIATTGDS